MKALKVPSNNHNNKRFFKCDFCKFFSSKNIPQNILLIRCDKCGNNLREISERDYQTLIFNYVNNNNQLHNNINLQNSKINNIKVNYKVNNRNNAMQNKLNIDQKNKIQMAMNILNSQQMNNINNNINPNFQNSTNLNNNNIIQIQNNMLNHQNSSNIPINNINNLNQIHNIPQNNPNLNFIRQNTTPIPQPAYITPVIPYQNNNNIESNNNPYKKSKSSNINSFDFWERIDSHKERKINNQSTSNRNIPALPSPSPFNNSNQQSMTTHNHNVNDDPMNEVLDDFFGDFFNETPSSRINPQSHGSIDHSPHIFFQSFFSPFGIGENVFNENYSSNFNRSFFGDIGNLLQFIQRGRKNPHPPATKEALSKLKRFPLQERFCQKKEGKLELPNCCICQCEIELGKETVLLPCGHMYHWDCCSQWLNTNNTCPICRFEIK